MVDRAVELAEAIRQQLIIDVTEYDHASEVESGHPLDPEAIGNLAFEVARVVYRDAARANPSPASEAARRVSSCPAGCGHGWWTVGDDSYDCNVAARLSEPA